MTVAESVLSKLTSDYDESLSKDSVSGKRMATRLNELSSIGKTSDSGVTRIGFSVEEKQAKQTVKAWMQQAGLQVTEDGAGNVVGRLSGKENGKAILSGSHVDSVPNGGNFDGPLGVIAALEVVEAWKETGYQPVQPFEVIVFSDEEGSRFGTGLVGSHMMTGLLSEEEKVVMQDEDGKSFKTVIEEYGSSLEVVQQAVRDLSDIELFVEVHIEQGKLLEKNNVAVGAVKGIAGPVRVNITFVGEAGHAGNTPMNDRKDAMVAASHFIHALSTIPQNFSETAVATVGKLQVYPNGVNVIAQKVELTVDVRDIHEDKRGELVKAIMYAADKAGIAHNVEVSSQQTLDVKPLLIKQQILESMKKSIQTEGIEPMELMSGAGHDAMVMGRKVPAAMLFVRSENGVSHNPAEWTDLNDCVTAVHILKHFIEKQMEK